MIALGDVREPQSMSCITSVGMEVLRRCMSEAGCLDRKTRASKWIRTTKRQGETEDEYGRRVDDLSYCQRAKRSKNPRRVPEFKFYLNEGWIVSAQEAKVIGKALRRWTSKHKRAEFSWIDDWKFVLEFTAFCERCGKSHGFRVQ